MKKLLTHMAWANREIFAEVSKLPDSALDAFDDNPEWTVREIISHICESSTWYAWCLREDGASFDWESHVAQSKVQPRISSDIQELIEVQKITDALLLESEKYPDGLLSVELDGSPYTCARSTIITQSIHHATEHRTQMVAALVAANFTDINLDKYHLWGFTDLQK